jgi:hypothetical protein
VQADVPQRLGRAFLGHRGRQARDTAQVGDELGRGHVGRKAVVLGHVAEQGPDRLAAGLAVVAEHRGLALGRRDEAKQDLYQRGLSRAVGADQGDDLAIVDVEGLITSMAMSRSGRNNHTNDKAQDCKALHRFLHFGMRIRASDVVDQIGQRFPSAKMEVQTTKST